MKRSSKIIFSSVVIIASLIVLFGLFSYFLLIRSLPDYSGEKSVAGLENVVTVYRDSFAVPYISAQSEKDAYYTLGYLHAQERMFQMDLLRRAGTGRLSAVFGRETSNFDKMFKTLALERRVKNYFPRLNEKSRNILIAYSKGINAYLNENRNNAAVEFDVLGYSPEDWRPEHSLVIAKLMAWELNISWWSDIAFAHLIQKLGEEKVKEIIPDFPENAPVIIPEQFGSLSEINTDLIKTDQEFRKFIGFEGTHIGSNNWVVNSETSVSGKPIIANDPHLAFRAPGRWYMANMKGGDLSVSGFTLPGMPGVVIGKNKNISWVLTNVMADDSDFYLEKLDSTKQYYMLDNEWKNLTFYKDTILVKDAEDIILEIAETHRGPIISNIHPYNYLYNNEYQSEAVISMRWTALDFSDEFLGIYLINKAAGWAEFKDGVKEFTVPGQNFIYADINGNIGYICGARLPKRSSNSPTMVYDGTISKYDWTGFIPFDEMPMVYNPGRNFLATANNKTMLEFKYHISNLWEPPSRIERIEELLNSKSKHSVADFKKYQNDFFSKYASRIVPEILKAFEGAKISDKNLEFSLELLRKWNFEMDLKSQTPAIYAVFFQHLLKNTFMDEMGEELFKEYIFIANIPYRVINSLLSKDYSFWFDNIKTEVIESKEQIIRKSLVDALADLENRLGKNIAVWQWKELHSLTFKHFFSGRSSIVDRIVNVGPFEISGDGTTVCNTEYSFEDPYSVKLGPSMRYIFDFSEPETYHYILAGGQSGHPISEHYADMTKLWLKGEYLKMNTDFAVIAERAEDILILNPK